ncbi:MAG: SdpI family protein [Oscillospiraceae bacterium]|nr:SdpI family protein [Oscillospiraceae bacterium]
MKHAKHNLPWVIVSSLLACFPLWIGAFFWSSLPDELPIHFNFSGQADGYGGKLSVVVGLPLFFLVMHLLVVFTTKPDLEHPDKSVNNKLHLLFLALIPVVSVFSSALIFAEALHWKLDFLVMIQLLFAVLYLVFGNYLPKIRRNQFVGTRLPWTLKSDSNWDKTNRLSGWLFCIFGFLFLLNAFLKIGGGSGMAILLIGSLLAGAVIPTVYSYSLSRNE